MNILITGAAGFIGGHLCQALGRTEHKVIGIDNFDPFYSSTIKEKNLDLLKSFPNFEFFNISINDQQRIEDLFIKAKIELVVHLAAKAGVRPSLEDPRGYLHANVDGTLSLLEACRKNGIKHFIFASSSSVYGNNPKVPFEEGDFLSGILSPYAASKLAGETYTRLYHNLYEISVINLRFFTVYGPRQRPDLAIHKFMKSLLMNTPVTIYGDGTMARDYTYVEDTVQGIMGALNLLENSKKPMYRIYNLGNSTPVDLNHLLKEIEGISKLKFLRNYAPVPPGDVPQTFANIEKAKKDLGYQPNYPLEKGLQQMWQWVKSIYQ